MKWPGTASRARVVALFALCLWLLLATSARASALPSAQPLLAGSSLSVSVSAWSPSISSSVRALDPEPVPSESASPSPTSSVEPTVVSLSGEDRMWLGTVLLLLLLVTTAGTTRLLLR